MNLKQLQSSWKDEESYHKEIHESFCELVDGDSALCTHRKFIDDHVYGFGEKSFWWLWKLILDELPIPIATDEDKYKVFTNGVGVTSNSFRPSLLEVGVFKGATLSVWNLLRPDANIFGVTPLDSTGIGWEGDYWQFIKDIHKEFNQQTPLIFKGLSESKEAIEQAQGFAPYCVVYIDGGHERHHIDNDLLHYAPMVQQGGYLVIDDACNDMKMEWGYFQGIQPVTDGVLAYMAENGDKWEFITNVKHLRLYKRK